MPVLALIPMLWWGQPEPPSLGLDSLWLSWSAPADCPTADEVISLTTGHLGRTPTSAEITVRASISSTDTNRFQLDLHTDQAGVQTDRELVADACQALADACALIVALSVDPVAVATHRPPPSLVPAPLPAPRLPSTSVEPSVSRPSSSEPTTTRLAETARPRPRTSLDLHASVGGGAELGALPGVSGGPALSLALAWPRVRAELTGFWLAPRTASRSAGSVRVQMGAATVRACGRVVAGRVELPVCGGWEVGGMRGRGLEAPEARTNSGLWLAAHASVGVAVWFRATAAIVTRLDLAVPVLLPAFEVRDPGDPITLFAPYDVSGRLWLAIEGKWRIRDGTGGSRGIPR